MSCNPPPPPALFAPQFADPRRPGSIGSLKNVKKDVTEMRKGTECGIGFEAWEDFQAGDTVQTFEEVSEKRKLTV